MPWSNLKKKLACWLWGVSLGAAVFAAWLFWTPPLETLRTHNPVCTRLMLIRQKQAASRGQKYRVDQRWVPLRRISPHLRQAVIAVEDDLFYRHAGVDVNALWLSLKHDLRHRGFVQGGSTITQQVVKNLYLHPRKSPVRKIKEAVIALRLERVLGKKRILEIYLNIAEWGRGIYGAEAAAQRYFGKSAADLSVAEAVALAAVLPSPLRHSPVQVDRFLAWRVRWVQRQLKGRGYDFAPAAGNIQPLPEEVVEASPENADVPDFPLPEPPGEAGACATLPGTSVGRPPEGAPLGFSPTAEGL